MDIKISKSLLNRNLNGTIFGGTIFASVDPIHTLLLDQIFKRKDIKKTVTWLKSAKISYLKPAAKNLIFSVKIAKEDVQKALDEVKTSGKVVREFEISIYDQAGVLCATSINEIYIRDLSAARTKSSTISEPKT
ncbi:translation elongation factor P (EF-P) [Sphingobacterium deserti]|uniref:Translation elongation factor P (EF-P) n=2 Tax=Sphingobacterium deserti TaxID=1229276 RepID=A0A0B8T3U6_9SPHI|nr:translation elongation factor P (EF-P) [Sphingobacterium deserti]